MKITPSETMLRGQWHTRGGVPVADEACHRIDLLVRDHLVEVGRDPSGWDALYRDPDDDRLWELIYPHSELHGGGPPELHVISPEAAKQKYGDAAGGG